MRYLILQYSSLYKSLNFQCLLFSFPLSLSLQGTPQPFKQLLLPSETLALQNCHFWSHMLLSPFPFLHHLQVFCSTRSQTCSQYFPIYELSRFWDTRGNQLHPRGWALELPLLVQDIYFPTEMQPEVFGIPCLGFRHD